VAGERLMLFGPGADSGTFDYFTEAVMGRAKSSRGDFTASEDDNTLVQGVENNKSRSATSASPTTRRTRTSCARSRSTAARPGAAERRERDQRHLPAAVAPLFVYVKESSAARPEVREFVQFMMTQGAALVSEVGYVPLPDRAYKLAWQHFNNKKLGSVFGGHPKVGITSTSCW